MSAAGILLEVFLELQKACPRSPHYIDSAARGDGKLLDDWNIIVPKSLIIKDWEE